MTETSDSGFTEINQSRTSEGSQCDTKSGNTSPNSNSMDENNSLTAACENSENLAIGKIESEQEEDVNGESSMNNDDDSSSASSSSSSEDSDEDYDDSERSGNEKSSVLSWVSSNH